MKRKLPIAIVLALLATVAQAQPIIIPPAEPVEAGKSIALRIDGLTTAQCDAAVIQTNMPQAKAVYAHGPLGGEWLYFRAESEGLCTVVVQVPQPGLDLIAMVSIQVGKGGPPPPPPPPLGERIVVVLYQANKRTSDEAALMNATEIETYMTDKGHTYRAEDPDLTTGDDKPSPFLAPFVSAVEAKGLTYPVLCVGVESPEGVEVVSAEAFPSDVAGVLAAVKKGGG